MERMFQKSFSVAKRVRTETDSVPVLCLSLLRLVRWRGRSLIALYGDGTAGWRGRNHRAGARHLREHKVQKMIIANRTREVPKFWQMRLARK